MKTWVHTSMEHSTKAVANYLYEAGVLSRTPRSGFWFLDYDDHRSVAEHVHRMLHVAYALAHMANADRAKILEMVLFHDFSEARTSDLNYVHQKYVTVDEKRAVHDMTSTLPFGNCINDILAEYKERRSLEAIIVKDADNLELLLSIKECMDTGNDRAKTWVPAIVSRLKTEQAQKLAETILSTHADEWWFGDGSTIDTWWIDRNKKA